jgi:TonB family protein
MQAMQASPVFEKTELGTGEIHTTHGTLSAQARRLLILIDGQRDLQDLASLIGADAVQQWLPALANQGYIRPLDRTAEAVPAALANTLQRNTRQTTVPAEKNTIQRHSRPATVAIDKNTVQKNTLQRTTTTSSAAQREAPVANAPAAPVSAKSSLPVGLIAGAIAALAAAGGGAWYFTRPAGPAAPPAVAESTDASAAPAPAAPAAVAASAPDVVPVPTPALSPLERLAREAPAAPRVDAVAARAAAEKLADEAAGRSRRDAPTVVAAAPPAQMPLAAPVAAPAAAPIKAPPPLPRAPEQAPAPAPVATVVAPAVPTPAPVATLASATPAAPKPLVLTPVKHDLPGLSRRARRAGIDSGHAIVRLYVKADGTIDKVDLLKAEPPQIYDADVQRTLQSWTFQPPGQATQKDVELTFKP